MTGRISRRAFLRSAGLMAAAAGLARFAAEQTAGGMRHALPRAGGLRVASALPLPIPHVHNSQMAGWMDDQLNSFDLVLAPAYAAAGLIARGGLARLAGPRGRAHDPDGAYTVPFAYRVGMPLSAEGGVAEWADLGAEGLPDEPRLALGAALLRRGYSPNDPHPGRVAQAMADLADPQFGAASGAALALLDPAQAASLPRPAAGVMLLEYDWVIPVGTARAAEAAAFVAELTPALPPAWPRERVIPLMPIMG